MHGTPIFSGALRREVIVLIFVKAAALVAIYQLFFASAEKGPHDPDSISRHVLSPLPQY